MNERHVHVAIIGAGTAGLVALSEVRKRTNEVVLIDDGPLGTTCARVGCMPSKVLIQVANDYHRRLVLHQMGIAGADGLTINTADVMKHVRSLRDHFAMGMVEKTKALGTQLIRGHARFLEPGVLEVNGGRIMAKSIIIATGSRPVVPGDWKGWGDRLITTDTLFDLEDLPGSIAVIGLGVIGVEIGQALARLGVDVIGMEKTTDIAGLTDPEVNEYAANTLAKDFPLWRGSPAELPKPGGKLIVTSGDRTKEVDAVLVALGRRPNVEELGLENLSVMLRPDGLPEFNPETLQVGDLRVFIAGDANGIVPVLHEAWNDGLVAGFNSTQADAQSFTRHTPLLITFTDPNICIAGRSFASIRECGIITGSVSFESQGRALIRGENCGLLKLYADSETGKLLGSEMFAPAGEHLAHLLAWAIQQQLTVHDILKMPFYHPVLEEGLRKAVRDIAKALPSRLTPAEVLLFDETPADGLC